LWKTVRGIAYGLFWPGNKNGDRMVAVDRYQAVQQPAVFLKKTRKNYLKWLNFKKLAML
jgi:hypothetical protein